MIGPSLGQDENISSNSRLHDDFRLGHEEEASQENIVILDANNSLAFSELNCENQPTRLEVVIVQGTWNESDESTNLTLTSDIFDNLETVECNNGRNTTNIVSEIEANEHGFTREFILNNREEPAEIEKDPLADDETEKDNEENNLLWLLNYKLDSMFNVDDVGHDHNYPGNEYYEFGKNSAYKDGIGGRTSVPGGIFGTRIYSGDMFNGKVRRGSNVSLYRRSLPNLNNPSSIHPSTSSPLISANPNSNHQGCANMLRKPPFTYTEMIEQALSESGQLTVSGIYNWISEHFPFYKANDDRWKNSVRHNLSINPHFKKGSKARHGAGHLWTIATQEDRPRTASRKRRLEQFWAQTQCCHPQAMGRSSPTTLAVESITMPEDITDVNCVPLSNKMELDIMEDVKGGITISMEENKENSDKRIFVPQVFCPITHNGPKAHIVSLEQSAEEILSGVKKEVEVQYLTPLQQKRASVATSTPFPINTKEIAEHIPFPADFLNPVSKREVVEESGLFLLDDGTVASFVVADENFPAGVIPEMENGEVIVSDNLFGEDLNFQYQELVSPQAAQQLHV